jgi:hypothetical protein
VESGHSLMWRLSVAALQEQVDAIRTGGGFSDL